MVDNIITKTLLPALARGNKAQVTTGNNDFAYVVT